MLCFLLVRASYSEGTCLVVEINKFGEISARKINVLKESSNKNNLVGTAACKSNDDEGGNPVTVAIVRSIFDKIFLLDYKLY